MDMVILTNLHQNELKGRLSKDLIMLVKPNITFMALFTALGGFWLAPGEATTSVLLWTLLGTALIVGSANALNCYLERETDGLMARTKSRPLPAQRMEPAIALKFGLCLGALALPILYMFANPLTALLAAVALVSYVWIYTPMKQVSAWALLVGSVPGAIPPLLGWTAATGTLDGAGLALFGILFVWQLPHFIAISMYRQAEYDRAGIKTVAGQLGLNAARWQILLWTTALALVSFSLVPLQLAGTFFLVSSTVVGIGFIGLAIWGFVSDRPNRWARAIFLYSLLYMNLIVVFLVVDTQWDRVMNLLG